MSLITKTLSFDISVSYCLDYYNSLLYAAASYHEATVSPELSCTSGAICCDLSTPVLQQLQALAAGQTTGRL